MSTKILIQNYGLSANEADEIWWYWRENLYKNRRKVLSQTILLFILFEVPLCLAVNNPLFQSFEFTLRITLSSIIMIGGTFLVFIIIGKITLPKIEKEFQEYIQGNSPNEILLNIHNGS